VKKASKLMIKLEVEGKGALDSFITSVDHIAGFLEQASGKNMGSKVKELWEEFKSSIGEHINCVNNMRKVAVELGEK